MSAVGDVGASAVSVLAPNGRRVTVRIGPSTALLQILEEVCRKQNFNPHDYDLKFQRSVLDLSLQWRFVKLPNNARLEMVPVFHRRAGTKAMVQIALLLDDGSRLQDTFCSSQTLWEILGHFPQTREYMEQFCEISPICIYMHDEITGKAALEKTSLKSLGLTGGTATIRVVMKMLTSSHADVGKSDSPSEELAARPSSGNEPAAMACSDEAFSANKCIEEQGSSAELSPPSEPVPLSFVPFIGSGQRLGGSSSEAVIAPILDVLLSNLTTTLLNSKGSSQAKCSQEKLKEPKEGWEREPIVCHPDLKEPLDFEAEDLPEEFFEVTVDDVRKRLTQLQNERKRLEEAPLMTHASRETQMKKKLKRYPKVVLRINFPDGYILQGVFHPNETVGALRSFVKSHLADPDISFYLFIAPPRSILTDDSVTLFQANLFPAAVVRFGSETHNDYYLRLDLLKSAVSPSEADLLVARYLSRSVAPIVPPKLGSVFGPPSEAADDKGPTESAATLEVQEPPGRRTASEKVPKWLKLPGGKR